MCGFDRRIQKVNEYVSEEGIGKKRVCEGLGFI
jgi:hypothetical protein